VEEVPLPPLSMMKSAKAFPAKKLVKRTRENRKCTAEKRLLFFMRIDPYWNLNNPGKLAHTPSRFSKFPQAFDVKKTLSHTKKNTMDIDRHGIVTGFIY
jgi:hypothetical protein